MVAPAILSMAIAPFFSPWLHVYGIRPWTAMAVLNAGFAILFLVAFGWTGRRREMTAG
jgi:hypothetical protein